MTVSLVVRSALALLLGVAVTALALQHASVPPASAINAAVGGEGGSGPVLAPPSPRMLPPAAQPRFSHRPGTGQRPAAATPTPRPVLMHPGLDVAAFPNVPGHIFFDTIDHNIAFVTGHHARRMFTGDGSSVAPALSPDGRLLAWVELKRNYSDIFITGLGLGRDGSVVALTTTVLTQDSSPPPALQAVPAPPGYDPRYLWWANKPAWLPDGQHLLYLSDRPGFDPNNPENATMSVWEQGLSDPITNAVALSAPAAGTGGHDSAAWRPHDPSVFLYVNYFQDTTTLPAGEGVIEAAFVPTGTAPSANAITANAIGLTPHGALEYHPAWSPDGHYIAFVEDKGAGHSTLMLMRFHRPGNTLDYYHAITVARGAGYVVQPFWSPDGRYLGYLAGSSGDFRLVIRRVDLSGRTPRFGQPITIPQAGAVSADYRPTWGP